MYNMPQANKIAIVKNRLGRKGPHYLETLTATEKKACNMIDGLFDTLATKVKPQYNEMIKSLQFRKLYRLDNENVDEWVGRLCVVAVECNYRELDRQLKEQFIHGLNDKCMLDKIIKEPTATNSNDEITSEGMLAWVKRVEAQRAQAGVLNTITELQQFDKVKIAKKTKEDNTRCPPGTTDQWHPCRYCGRLHVLRQYLAYAKTCTGCGRTGHFKKVCQSRRERTVNELEVEGSQEGNEGEIETVSIKSVHLNKNQSLLMAKLETQSGGNTIVIPYK